MQPQRTRVFLSRVFRVGLVLALLGVAAGAVSSVQTHDWSIHWHFDLSIEIYGKYATIPEGIGIGPDLWKNHTLDRWGMNPGTAPMHTHDSSGLVHIEVTAPAPGLKRNFTLEDFFNIWGVKLNEYCLSDICASNAVSIQMFVNGQRSYAFENYVPDLHCQGTCIDQILIQVGPSSPGAQMPGIPYDPILCDEFLYC